MSGLGVVVIPSAFLGDLLLHSTSYSHDLIQTLEAQGPCVGKVLDEAGDPPPEPFVPGHPPGLGQGLLLPNQCLFTVMDLEPFQGRDQGPCLPRRPEPHINTVQDPLLRGACKHHDHPLGHLCEVLPAAFRSLINKDHIQVRAVVHLAPAHLPQSHHGEITFFRRITSAGFLPGNGKGGVHQNLGEGGQLTIHRDLILHIKEVSQTDPQDLSVTVPPKDVQFVLQRGAGQKDPAHLLHHSLTVFFYGKIRTSHDDIQKVRVSDDRR